MTAPHTTRGRKPIEPNRPRAKTYEKLDALKAATREAALAELGRPVGQLVERLWNGSNRTNATHFEGEAIRLVSQLRSLYNRAVKIAKRAIEYREAIAADRDRHESSGLALAQLPPPLSWDEFIAQFPATQVLLSFVLAEINAPLGRVTRFPRRTPATPRDSLAGLSLIMNDAPDPRYLALQALALGAFPQLSRERCRSASVADVIDAETKAMRRALEREKKRRGKSKPKQ